LDVAYSDAAAYAAGITFCDWADARLSGKQTQMGCDLILVRVQVETNNPGPGTDTL